MQTGSIADVYACVAEYRLHDDDAEPGAKASLARLASALAQPLRMFLSRLLFGEPA